MKAQREFKFTCPACGQHIAGEAAYAGRKIRCPACKAAIRVPRPGEEKPKDRLPSAHLVVPAAAKGTAAPAKEGLRPPSVPKLAAKGTGKLPSTGKVAESSLLGASAAQSTSPKLEKAEAPEAAPLLTKSAAAPVKLTPPGEITLRLAGKVAGKLPPKKVPEAAKPAAPTPTPPPEPASAKVAVPATVIPPEPKGEGHFLCPVCSAELVAPAAASPAAETGVLPKAKLIRKAEPQTAAPAEKKAVVRVPSARPGGSMKPRMDYVLTGKRPVPLKPDKPALHQSAATKPAAATAGSPSAKGAREQK